MTSMTFTYYVCFIKIKHAPNVIKHQLFETLSSIGTTLWTQCSLEAHNMVNKVDHNTSRMCENNCRRINSNKQAQTSNNPAGWGTALGAWLLSSAAEGSTAGHYWSDIIRRIEGFWCLVKLSETNIQRLKQGFDSLFRRPLLASGWRHAQRTDQSAPSCGVAKLIDSAATVATKTLLTATPWQN